MRVLLVHNRYRPDAPSGENTVVDQEAQALADAGIAVELFQRHSAEIAEWSRARRAGLPIRVLWGERSRRDIRRTLGRFAPDVVHVHNTFPLITPSVLYVCRAARVPVVATFHNYRLVCANGALFREGRVCHDCFGRSFRPALVHGCYRDSRVATAPVVLGSLLHAPAWRNLVSAYVFISAAQRDLLETVHLPASRRFVRHNFIPAIPAMSGVTEPMSASSSPVHVVTYSGRLDAAKGVPHLMRSWDRFRARRPDSQLRLQLVGGGELEDEVQRWASGQSSVTVRGHVSREEAIGALAASRVAVVPSAWEETFGLVAVEAMSVGTAPLAPAHGAFPELITDGCEGGLYRPGEATSLADALVDVNDRPQEWDARGLRARAAYVERFSPRSSIDRLVDIYRFAIDNPVFAAGADVTVPEPSVVRTARRSR